MFKVFKWMPMIFAVARFRWPNPSPLLPIQRSGPLPFLTAYALTPLFIQRSGPLPFRRARDSCWPSFCRPILPLLRHRVAGEGRLLGVSPRDGGLLELSVIAEHLQNDQRAELKTICKGSVRFHHTGVAIQTQKPFQGLVILSREPGLSISGAFYYCLKHHLNQD